MEMTSLIIVGVVVLVAIITIIGILSRYRKCKSDELLVVYGKTGSHKEKVSERDAKGNLVDREVEIKTAKVYHGGAAFVWPIIQGYEVMSMQPIQLNLVLKNALSAQNIRVTIPTTVTVAISQEPLIMQNAANRLLGAEAKVFEHIQLGNVTVYGDSNTAGQFMANMAKNLAPSLEIARNLPIADSLKQIITGKKPEESPAKGDEFPPVK